VLRRDLVASAETNVCGHHAPGVVDNAQTFLVLVQKRYTSDDSTTSIHEILNTCNNKGFGCVGFKNTYMNSEVVFYDFGLPRLGSKMLQNAYSVSTCSGLVLGKIIVEYLT
jgi:hypothetical protein